MPHGGSDQQLSRWRPRLDLPSRSFSASVAAVVAVLLVAGCGYTLNGGFDPGIRTVAVPMFESREFRRGIEFQLTEAVHREIQTRTPFRLAHESVADTRLVGRVIEFDKAGGVGGVTGEARSLPLHLAVEVRWEDLRDKRVIAQTRVPIAPDALRLFARGSFAPETGQSLATAQQEAVRQIASQVVDLMEQPW